VAEIPGIDGVAPFSINPMMLTHGVQTATGVLVKGVDPELSLGVGAAGGKKPVLDLPLHVKRGSLEGLRLPDAKPPERPTFDPDLDPPPLLDPPGDPLDPLDRQGNDLLRKIEER